MDWIVPAGTFLACAWAVLASSFADKDRQERVFLAVLLFAAFGASNVSWLFDSLTKLAIMDGAILGLAARQWLSFRGAWRMQFALLAGIQLALDCLYEARTLAYSAYAIPYDLSFLMELAVISGGGSRNVWLHWVRHLSRLRASLPSRLRPAG